MGKDYDDFYNGISAMDRFGGDGSKMYQNHPLNYSNRSARDREIQQLRRDVEQLKAQRVHPVSSLNAVLAWSNQQLAQLEDETKQKRKHL